MDGPHHGGVRTSTDVGVHLATLARWRVVVAICLVTMPTAAYVWSNDKQAIYEATVQMKVQPATVDTSLLNNFNEVFPGTQPAIAAGREVKTTAVARDAIRKIPGEFADAREALDKIDVQVSADSGIVSVVAQAPTGPRAARLANAFATSFVQQRERGATSLLDGAVSRLTAQRERLPSTAGVARRQLSEQIQRLRALRASQGNNASIIEPAFAAADPVSPHPIRTAAIAGLIGLLLALLLVRLLTGLDRRVRSEDEVEQIMEAPVISMVPKRAFAVGPGGAEGRHAFEALRANLMFFALDRSVTSVLVTSPQMGDGKTTVATNLAVSYAQLGKDVVIVDADLRRPQVASKFGIAEETGFTEVLFGEVALDDALVEVDLDGGSGRLRVLTSGKTPPNPSELLASSTTQRILDELEQQADVLIIDSPPTTIVSDAIPLLDLVSGVLAVVRLHGTDRQRLHRLRSTLRTNETRMLGVALTGVSARVSPGYGYGYGAEAYRDAPSTNGSGSTREPAATSGRGLRGRPGAEQGQAANTAPLAPSRKARSKADGAAGQGGHGWFS